MVRTLSCPAEVPFYALHAALQIAFGWAGTHSFDFAVKDPDYVLDENPAALMAMIMRQDMNMRDRPGRKRHGQRRGHAARIRAAAHGSGRGGRCGD